MSAYRCGKCKTPFKARTRMNCPVDEYVKEILALKCPNCGGKKLFLGFSLSLTEDRHMRVDSKNKKTRIQDWLANGETGLSSESVVSFMEEGIEPASYPHDYADLRRVILLVDRIPEYEKRMHEMEKFAGWEKIAPIWEELVATIKKSDPDLLEPTGAESLLKGIYHDR